MDSTLVHLLAGGAGGTVGAIMTCPLEVVKTRLQSSVASFGQPQVYVSSVACVQRQQVLQLSTCHHAAHQLRQAAANSSLRAKGTSLGLVHCLKYIVQTEGPSALFKGLGPTLVGVAPSRAIYFYSYAQAKSTCNHSFLTPDSPLVHIIAASFAGFSACTATNPIWLIKTRLQLDQRCTSWAVASAEAQHVVVKVLAHLIHPTIAQPACTNVQHGSTGSNFTVRQCIRNVYREHGLRGFYKGITASYFGISETVIHFVIYEAVKLRLLEYSHPDSTGERSLSDFFRFMCAGAISKTCATTIAYPHEVARTRLREEGNRYRSFFQTLWTVCREEGYRGMYRGLVTQLVRQIPNTAIMMSTYEAVVYLLSGSCDDDDDDDI